MYDIALNEETRSLFQLTPVGRYFVAHGGYPAYANDVIMPLIAKLTVELHKTGVLCSEMYGMVRRRVQNHVLEEAAKEGYLCARPRRSNRRSMQERDHSKQFRLSMAVSYAEQKTNSEVVCESMERQLCVEIVKFKVSDRLGDGLKETIRLILTHTLRKRQRPFSKEYLDGKSFVGN